jgi:hypothetical protein
VAGCAGAASPTRGTYRSVLVSAGTRVHGPAGCRAAPFPGARAPAPYSSGERAELAAVARAQRRPAKRAWALAMVMFGIGAGLRPGELAALRGTRVTARGGRAVVHVSGGPAPRTVPVTARYAGRAAGWPAAPGTGSCSGPAPRTGPARTCRFCHLWLPPDGRRCPQAGAGPAICGYLAAGTPVPVLLAITGSPEAGSLVRCRHVPGICPSKGARGHAGARRPAGERRRPGPARCGGRGQRGDGGLAAELIDRSGKAPVIEAALAKATAPPPAATAPCSPRFCARPSTTGRCSSPRPPGCCSASSPVLPGPCSASRHRRHPPGVPGRLPPPPLLLPRHLCRSWTLGAAEKPAPDRRPASSRRPGNWPRARPRPPRQRLEAFINSPAKPASRS